MENYDKKKELGRFIRRKREALQPDILGIETTSRRRVKGLRREEAAFLSGVGLSWYTWLEQGKDIQVSSQVLLSIAKALAFTHQETKYALELAGYSFSDTAAFKTDKDSIISLQNVLDSLAYSPAIALDAYWNIVASNLSARLVFGNNQNTSAKDSNLLELIFLDSEYQRLFSDWKMKARELLAQFRVSISKKVGENEYALFIEQMKSKSDYFKECWEQYEIHSESTFDKTLAHSELGLLSFQYSSYIFTDEHGREFLIFINTPLQENNTEKKIKDTLAAIEC